MTNDEIRRNTEILMTNEPLHTRAPFDIRASDFFRHLSFVIRHSTTGSCSQCTARVKSRLSMNRSVLPASCRQRNRRKALPTRRRQHLVGGTVRLVRGSWSQSARKMSWRSQEKRIGQKAPLMSRMGTVMKAEQVINRVQVVEGD